MFDCNIHNKTSLALLSKKFLDVLTGVLLGTIAASLLCRLQILVGLEFGQSIPTVVHTVPELPQ